MTEGGKVIGLAHVIFNGYNPVLGTLRPPSDSRTRGIEGLQATSIQFRDIFIATELKEDIRHFLH